VKRQCYAAGCFAGELALQRRLLIRPRRRFGPVEPFEFGVKFLARGIIADFGRMLVEAESGAGVAHSVDDVAEFIDRHFMPASWRCGAFFSPSRVFLTPSRGREISPGYDDVHNRGHASRARKV
jgi:hypothetical protein